MRNIPVNLGGYKLRVSDEPTVKMVKDRKTGQDVPATDRATGEVQYTVSLFAKPREAGPNGKKAKGEEIKVTLLTDPGEIEEGTVVELIAPVLNHYEIREDGEFSSGVSFKANAVSPIGG